MNFFDEFCNEQDGPDTFWFKTWCRIKFAFFIVETYEGRAEVLVQAVVVTIGAIFTTVVAAAPGTKLTAIVLSPVRLTVQELPAIDVQPVQEERW